MREGGHYSLFIISCEKSIDGKTSLVIMKKEHRKPIRGWRLGFTPIMNQYVGSSFASGRQQETNDVVCVA